YDLVIAVQFSGTAGDVAVRRTPGKRDLRPQGTLQGESVRGSGTLGFGTSGMQNLVLRDRRKRPLPRLCPAAAASGAARLVSRSQFKGARRSFSCLGRHQ